MSAPRRLVRAVVLGGLLLVLALLVAHAAFSSWSRRRWSEASAAYEREVGPLQLIRWELPEVPAERNAATWISKGAAAVVLADGKRGGGTVQAIVGKPPEGWTAEEVATLREALALNTDALAILARSRDLDASTFGIQVRAGVKAKIPNLLEIMNAAKLVAARGMLALRDGDRSAAIGDAALLGAMARALDRESVTIVVLIGTAVERLQLRLAQPLLEDPSTTSAEIRDLTAGLRDGDLRADVARSFAAEGAAVCAAFRDRDSEFLGETSAPDPPGLGLVRAMTGDAAGAYCLEAFREVAGVLSEPDSRLRERLEETRTRFMGRSWGARLVGRLVLPNLLDSPTRASMNLALRRLARVAAAVRLRADANGSYPADLASVPEAAGPDPLTGGELRYSRLPDGSVRLELPGADAIARETLPHAVAAVTSFAWELPPPRRAAS